ncbi:MAG: DinB family protein, partial [Gemmataceae bacterium]
DLSDTDLLVRPVPQANHIAWQVGHLILTECSLADFLPAAHYPSLPEGFAAQHNKEMAGKEPATGFLERAAYVSLFNQAREATLCGLAALSEADLDRPLNGPLAQLAPTLGALILLQSNHTLMHAGQFSVVRRKLGKPVLL